MGEKAWNREVKEQISNTMLKLIRIDLNPIPAADGSVKKPRRADMAGMSDNVDRYATTALTHRT